MLVTSINDLPEVDTTTSGSSYFYNNEDLHPELHLTDIDNANFKNGSLRVEVYSEVLLSENEKVFVSEEGILETEIRDPDVILLASIGDTKVEIGIVDPNSTKHSLIVNFNENATIDLVQELLRSIQYSNSDTHVAEPGVRTITAVLQDGAGPNAFGERSVVIERDLTVFKGVSGDNGENLIKSSAELIDNEETLIGGIGADVLIGDGNDIINLELEREFAELFGISQPELKSNPIQFNGSGDYYAFENLSSLNDAGGLTVSLWMNPEQTNDWINVFIKENSFLLELQPDGTPRLRGEGGNYSSSFSHFADVAIPFGEWSHVATTINENGQAKLYLNGEVIIDANGSAAVTESPLVLGNRFFDDWFSGQMRDVQVWDLALSEAQVEEWLFSENKTSDEYYTAAQSNLLSEMAVSEVNEGGLKVNLGATESFEAGANMSWLLPEGFNAGSTFGNANTITDEFGVEDIVSPYRLVEGEAPFLIPTVSINAYKDWRYGEDGQSQKLSLHTGLNIYEFQANEILGVKAGIYLVTEQLDASDQIESVTLQHVERGHGTRQIIGSDLDDAVAGSIENDVISSGAGNDEIIGGQGDDLIAGGVGNDFIHGGAGDDVIYGNALDAAGDYEDTDTILGGAGADTIHGQSGDDIIYGGAGDDLIFAGEGNDTVYASTGLNITSSGQGEYLDGGAGNDTLSFEQIKNGILLDLVFGVVTLDEVDLNGEYLAEGDNVSEVIYLKLDEFGAYTFEKIIGSNVSDVLVNHTDAIIEIFGGAGNDTIYGAGHSEYLFGGEGDDLISGGVGKDTLEGGAGADTFVVTEDTFDSGNPYVNADVILDFNASEGDQIDLTSLGIETFSADNVSLEQNSNDTSQWDAVISIDTTDVNVRVIVENLASSGSSSQQVDDLIASILV